MTGSSCRQAAVFRIHLKIKNKKYVAGFVSLSFDQTLIAKDLPGLFKGEILGRDDYIRRQDLDRVKGLTHLFDCGDQPGQIPEKLGLVALLHVIYYLVVDLIDFADLTVIQPELALA
jgi:hypothetical protein